MSKTGLIAAIEELGLTTYEAQVYVAVLTAGSTTILNVARKTGMHRTTVYAVVDALRKKGLLHDEARGIKTRIAADSPEKLEQTLERKRVSFKDSLPELLRLYNKGGEDATFKLYEGLDAMQGVYTSILKDLRPRDEYCAVTSHGPWADLDRDFFIGFLEKKALLPVTNRILLQDTARGAESKKLERNYNEQIRILPKGVNLNTNLIITPQLIMMHSLEEPLTAAVLTEKSFVRMQKEFFEVLWRSSRDTLPGN